MTYFKTPSIALTLALLAAAILPHSASALPTGGIGGNGGSGGGGGYGPTTPIQVPDDTNNNIHVRHGWGQAVVMVMTPVVARNYVVRNYGPDNSILVIKYNAAGQRMALTPILNGGSLVVGVGVGEVLVAVDADPNTGWTDGFGATLTIQAHH